MPWNNRRIVEWTLAVLVILALTGVFGREFRTVQGQGELAALKTTLGALRTALVIDHLKNNIDGQPNGPVQRNPFLLLDHIPSNYYGTLASLKGQPLPAGNWVFDGYCNCIGYEPLYPQSLRNVTDAPTLWFRISAPPGPLQVTPVDDYIWQGELVR